MSEFKLKFLQLFGVFVLFSLGMTLNGIIPAYAIDTFDSGLDGWVYVGSSGYSLANNGNMAYISGNGFSVHAGAEKTFDVSNADSVTLSFDWRASSGCSCSSTTNFRMLISDTLGNTLSSQSLQLGGTTNTGIKSYSADITGIVSGHDSIVIRMWLNDSWSSNWNQKIWWDNVDLQVTQSQQDTISPTLTIPSDVTTEATGQSTTANIGTATATDDIDPNPTITNNATSSYPIGTTKILWTATDSSNNYSTALQTITIQDTTPPTLTIPNDVTAEATGQSTTVNIGIATATDLVDSNPIISNNSTGTFSIGTTAILWTVTDSFGNSNNAIQTITIPDPRKPTQGITPLNDLNTWIQEKGGVYFGMGIFTFGFLLIGSMASPKTVPIFTILLMAMAGFLHVTEIFVLPAWFWGIAVIMTITLVLKRKS